MPVPFGSHPHRPPCPWDKEFRFPKLFRVASSHASIPGRLCRPASPTPPPRFRVQALRTRRRRPSPHGWGLSAALAPSSARCAAAILSPESARRPQTPRREFRRRTLTSRAGPCGAPRRPRDNLPPTGPLAPLGSFWRGGEGAQALVPVCR